MEQYSGLASPGAESTLDPDHGAFGTASNMAYSSFSHIGEVQNLSFAVGLRTRPASREAISREASRGWAL